MSTTRRKPGEGTIRTLGSGRKQVGVTLANGKREWSRTTYATEAEAEAALTGLVAVIADTGAAPVGGVTFDAYAQLVLDRAERAKTHAPKTIDTYRNRYSVSLACAPWVGHPLRAINGRMVTRHMDDVDRKAARGTAVVALAVARMVFGAALRDGLIDTDPTQGYRFPRRRRVEADEDVDTRSFVSVEQFAALLEVATPAERCMMRFALGTGLRLGEMITLHRHNVHLDDVHPYIDVRYGGRYGGALQPTKGRKSRRVYLVGPALPAAREWVDVHLVAHRRNPHGLMFPAPGGTFRSSRRFLLGKRGGVERWPLLLAAAGLADASPPIVWHSFRHSCATALLSGLWGKKWAPDEVQRHLGHESLDTTLGYARLVDERMSELAAVTTGARSREVHGVQQLAEIARQSSMGAKKCCFSDVSEWIREVAPLGDHAVIAIARGSMDGVDALLAMGWQHPLVAALLAATEAGPHQPARVLEFVRLVHRVHGADASRGVGT